MGNGKFLYVVACQFSDAAVGERWADWLLDKHMADVIEAGAESATLVKLDGDECAYEVHYVFAGRAQYEMYLRDHAPRLRQDGLHLFPLELGLSYARRAGEIAGIRP